MVHADGWVSIMQVNELVDEIGAGMKAAAGDSPWVRLDLRVTGAGLMSGTRLGVEGADGAVDWRSELGDEIAIKCDDLREAMYQDGRGTWYNARLTLTADGDLESDFDYDSPPYEGKPDPELLAEDQAEYPRDQEHLPDWHPAKASG